MASVVLLRIIGILLLIAVNAFFVAAEFALVSIRDTRIQQLVQARRIGARTVQKLQQSFDDVLLMVQLGVTLASLALGWLGEPAIAALLQRVIGEIPHSALYSHVIAVAIALALITYFQVILGEIVPKSLALTRGEQVALAVAGPMDFFITLFRPGLFLMKGGSRIILRGFGAKMAREGGVHSAEELKLAVTGSRRVGLIPEAQEEIIHHALELGEVTVREIMVPRPDIFSLPADLPLEEASMRITDENRARVPLYEPQQGREHIIGVVHSKDLLRAMSLRARRVARGIAAPEIKIRQLMRDVMMVPESKPLIDLLEEFRSRKRQMAVVLDEFGSTAGLVTLEDVLEELVGEIEDEFQVIEQLPMAFSGGSKTLDGAENIRDLENQFELKLPRDQGFETLGGFVLARLQHIPRAGESFIFEGKKFTVVSMEGLRVGEVRVDSEPAPAAGKDIA